MLTLADVLAMLRLIRRVRLHVDDAKGHVNRNVDSRHKLHPGNYRRSAEKYRIISSIFQTLAKGSTSTLCRNRDTEANGRRIFSAMLMREVSQYEGCVALEALLSIFEASRSEPPFRRLEFAIGLLETGKDVLRNEFGAIGSFLHLARLRRPRACFVYHCRRCARGYIKRSTQKPNDVHGAPCGKLAL